jgi:hypothetical protein
LDRESNFGRQDIGTQVIEDGVFEAKLRSHLQVLQWKRQLSSMVCNPRTRKLETVWLARCGKVGWRTAMLSDGRNGVV